MGGRKIKVAVVDDERSFVFMVKLNLEETGKYEVLALSEGSDAVKAIKDFQPDIILLDLVMPDIDGITICEMLNKELSGSKPPIVILSALDRQVDRLVAQKLGVVDCLVKPIDAKNLAIAIEKNLTRPSQREKS